MFNFYNKSIIIFAILSIYPISSNSQDLNFRFTHLTTDDGLSQSNITSIFQDKDGFMWFGTFNGLNRFDGYDFEIFNYSFEDSQSISHNYISDIFQDFDGYLWIGTSDGLNRYDPKTNRWKSFKHRSDDTSGISDNQIESILQDKRGRLWIGTRNNGLDLYDSKKETFSNFTKNNKNLSSNRIRVLFEDSDQNLWIAYWNGTIDVIKWINESEYTVTSFMLSESPITAIIESGDEHIWVGTQGNGLYKLKYENNKILKNDHYFVNRNIPGISSNIILCLMIDNENKLWIGTEDEGINILDLKTNTFEYCKYDPFDESSLNHDSVWEIYQDDSNNIWVGTYAHGINLLTNRNPFFSHYKHNEGNNNDLSNNMVNAFAEDQQNNLWIATDGGGLNLFDRSDNRFYKFTRENSNIKTDIIVSLLNDSQGRLWIGTWTDGLYQFNKKTKNFTKNNKTGNKLGSDRILHILEDKDGGLWLSTFYGGLTYFNIDQKIARVFNTENSGLSDNYVRVTYQDFNGNLWIGTDSGLDFYDRGKEKFINYKHDENIAASLSKGFVHTILQTKDSTIWIGTTTGLNKFDPTTNSFRHFNQSHGLPNNEIKCIIEDKEGILWLSTNKGISIFDVKSASFRNYDVSDGLQGNEYNIRSGYKTNSGEIIFGGNNGFNIFKPGIPQINKLIPDVFITDFKLFNKTVLIGAFNSLLSKNIRYTKDIRLSYDATAFSFDFVALNYVSAEKNQYAYMMEGFESEWNYVGTKRTATYTNLDPGNYVFKVKAANNDGIWNEQGTSINIAIDPPFWKTWWAYLLQFLLIVGIIAFLVYYFISRQNLKNALDMEHLELEKMYELDQMKTQFFSNISHEFHSPMTLILSPLEKLISFQNIDSKTKESLKLIQRGARRLQRMTNQLRDFQKIESGELQLILSKGDIIYFLNETVHSFHDYAIDHQISYTFKAEPENLMVWFDDDKLDKILYNLLSNAFKFTPDGGKVSVDVSVINHEDIEKSHKYNDCPSQMIQIIVSDSGIGIPDNKIQNIFERYYRSEKNAQREYQGSGVGLAFVYELIKLYQGDISVESNAGEGTKFIVKIPLDEHYLEEKQLVSEFKITTADYKTDIRSTSANGSKAEEEMPVILIVEDDDEVRKYIKNSLDSKYRIFSAPNGEEGILKAAQIIPDLVVSDIKMPLKNGIELCNQLKHDEKTSHIPIILLTSFTEKEYKIEGLAKGADAYISKPFSIDELEAYISNLLNSRKKLKEKYGRQVLLEPTKLEIEDIDEKFLKRLMETIESHISDDRFNAEVLSKKIGMSRMQLYRKLRGLTGQTVHEFIRSIKLKRAVQLLKEKRMTITEIAYEVGFNDLTYFARCFRKQYKKSPSEFISKNK